MKHNPGAGSGAPIPARRADTLFQDVWLHDERRRMRAGVREFVEDVLRPVAHRLNTTPASREIFPRAEFDAMARAVLYPIPNPADAGGRGLEFPALAALTVVEEQGYFSPGLLSASGALALGRMGIGAIGVTMAAFSGEKDRS